MIRPDDESKSFQSRWNTLVRILLVESSVKLVARTAMDYASWEDGTGVFTGNARLAVTTGCSDKTIRTAWATLRAIGMAHRVERGSSSKVQSDRYNLAIPSHWARLAIVGPNERKFTCLQCGKRFVAPPVCVLTDDGDAVWSLPKTCFCPPPRKRQGRPAPVPCQTAWLRERGIAWGDLTTDEAWKLFREARGDDW